MSRYSLTFLLLLQFSVSQGQQQIRSGVKPNIILVIADDLGAKDIQPYGNKVVRTPHLEHLASQSLLFTQAFAASPTCGPSRSSILTGLMPMRHGAHGNHSAVKEGTLSLVQYLRPLGYRIAIAGKLHVGPQEVFPFEYVSKTNVVEPGFEETPGLHYDLDLNPVDKWLSQQEKNKPFMLVVADHSPHVIWPEQPEYDPNEVDIPTKHIDSKETRKSRARYYTDVTKMDGNVGKLLKSLDRHRLNENTIVVFTSDQGPQWPFGKWSLYEDGVRVPLLIRWPKVVKPGTKTNALVSLVDLVPTFVELGKGEVPEGIDGKSFLPVILGKKNAHREVVFATHTGDNQTNRAPARMLRTSRYKYILNLAPEILYTTHMDLAKDHDGGREYWDSWREKSFKDEHAASVLWKYHNRPGEELYDLGADSNEMKNLAFDEKYSRTLAQFRKQMSAWRSGQADKETGPEVILGNKGDQSSKRKR